MVNPESENRGEGLPFDPTTDASELDPATMDPEERRIAAMRAYYELERMERERAAAVDFLAECAGLTEDDMERIAAQAGIDDEAEYEKSGRAESTAPAEE